MTPADSIPSRDRWKSKLEIYRSALAHTLSLHETSQGEVSQGEVSEGEASEVDSAPVEVSAPISVSTRIASELEPHSEVEHGPATISSLPFSIDRMVKQIRRNRPYLLGIGTISGLNASACQETRVPLADQLSQALNRKTLVILVDQDAMTACVSQPVACSAHSMVYWKPYAASVPEKKLWYAQLANLPVWRKVFDLIILDMGDPDSPTFERLGKLCDGLVMQWSESTVEKPLIQKWKRVQKNNPNILGAWSIRAVPVASAA